MIEIFAIIQFCRLVGRTLRPVDVRPVPWQVLTVALWFGGEFLGLILGLLFFGPGKNGDFPLASYFLALLGAFGGAILSVHLARRRAARAIAARANCRTCGYSRDGLNPDAPCPECGSVPPR